MITNPSIDAEGTMSTPHLIAVDTHRAERTLWLGLRDGTPVDPVLETGRNRHDRVLADGVARWLNDHPDWRDSLAGVAVVNGPGGFTGLRVGVAFATGLATALGLPVLPVSTPRLLAAHGGGTPVLALTRAGGDAVRGQLVRIDDAGFRELCPAVEFEPASLATLTVDHPAIGLQAAIHEHGPALPLGEGFERHRDTLITWLTGHLATVEPLPPDQALARAAITAWQDGLAVSPQDVDVDYGADFQPTPKPGA